MKKLLLLFLFALPCFAQTPGVRFGDGNPIQTSPAPGGPVYSNANAVINFCASPANAVPCTNKAITYTDQTLIVPCPTSTQVVLAGTNACKGTTDGNGNWGVWVPANTYSWTVTLQNGSSIGPFTVTLSSNGGTGGPPPAKIQSRIGSATCGVISGQSSIQLGCGPGNGSDIEVSQQSLNSGALAAPAVCPTQAPCVAQQVSTSINIVPVTSTPFAITSGMIGNEIILKAGASALTIPQAGSTGFPIGATFFVWNLSASVAGSLTPATSTINGGSTNVSGAPVAVVNPGDFCTLTNDGGNYWLACTSQSDQIVPVGVDPTGSTDSGTTLQVAMTLAYGVGKELFLPPGTYASSVNLVSGGANFRMKGAGSSITSITGSGTGPVMAMGSGTIGAVQPSGYLKDIHIVGKGPGTAHSGYTCVLLNGMVQFVVENVTVDQCDVGFGALNNNYGSIWRNVRGGYGGTSLNVGFDFEADASDGSDLSIYDAWVTGAHGAMWISGTHGVHVYGGQFTGVESTSTDTEGAFTLGKAWVSGNLGEVAMDIHGTSIEGTQNMWALRAYSQVDLLAAGMFLYPSISADPALGVYKNTASQNSQTTFLNTELSGYFTSATLISVSGGYANTSYNEFGTYSAENNPHFAGTSTYTQTMWTAGAGNTGYGGVSQLNTQSSLTLGGPFIANGLLCFGNYSGYCSTFVAPNGLMSNVTITTPSSSGTSTVTIASGTATLPTSTSITSGSCTAITPVTATGVATTDLIDVGFSGDPTGVVGFQPGSMLTIVPYPSAGDINIKMCNNSGSTITLGTNVVLNWSVRR